MNVLCGVALLVTALVSSTRAGPSGSSRIINGTEVSIDQVPYQVFLSIGCGGSILTERLIATAAHCTEYGNEFIRAGSSNRESGGQVVKVTKQIIHPKYNEGTLSYDFALIVLAEDLVFNENVQPIALTRDPVPDGTVFIVSGWGDSYDSSIDWRFLRAVELPQINYDECKEMYKDSQYSSFIDESMVCAGYVEGLKSSCDGDSGGPLVFNKTLYGVVSWSEKPCAQPRFPTLFGSIPKVFDWYTDLMQITL